MFVFITHLAIAAIIGFVASDLLWRIFRVSFNRRLEEIEQLIAQFRERGAIRERRVKAMLAEVRLIWREIEKQREHGSKGD